MDQDFYIEETSPFKIFITIVFFMALIAGGIYFYLSYKNADNIKLKNVTIELGDKLPTNIDYYASGNNLETYTINLTSISVDDN